MARMTEIWHCELFGTILNRFSGPLTVAYSVLRYGRLRKYSINLKVNQWHKNGRYVVSNNELNELTLIYKNINKILYIIHKTIYKLQLTPTNAY